MFSADIDPRKALFESFILSNLSRNEVNCRRNKLYYNMNNNYNISFKKNGFLFTWLAYKIVSNVGFVEVATVSTLEFDSFGYLPPTVEDLVIGCFDNHSKSLESLSVIRGGWSVFSLFSCELDNKSWFDLDPFPLFFSRVFEGFRLGLIFGLLDF